MKLRLVRPASLLVLASAALTAQVARQENVVPLKNWATPLYWQPNQTEREADIAVLTAGTAGRSSRFRRTRCPATLSRSSRSRPAA